MQKQLTLPTSVATKSQLLSLRENLEEVLEAITQNNIRLNEDVDAQPAPDVSGALASLLSINKLKPTQEVLLGLKEWVEYLLHHAPIVRLTFSSEPGPEELTRLIEWFRQQSEMVVLLHIGLQPSIAAGVMLRTTSHRYDFSLRGDLLKRTDKFIDAINRVADHVAQAQAPAQRAPQEATQ